MWVRRVRILGVDPERLWRWRRRGRGSRAGEGGEWEGLQGVIGAVGGRESGAIEGRASTGRRGKGMVAGREGRKGVGAWFVGERAARRREWEHGHEWDGNRGGRRTKAERRGGTRRRRARRGWRKDGDAGRGRSGWGRRGGGIRGGRRVKVRQRGGLCYLMGERPQGHGTRRGRKAGGAAPTEHRKVRVEMGWDGHRCSEARKERVGPGCESCGDLNRPRWHEMEEDNQREWAPQRWRPRRRQPQTGCEPEEERIWHEEVMSAAQVGEGERGRGTRGTVGARSAEEEFTRLSGEGDRGRGTCGTVGGRSWGSSLWTLVWRREA